MMAHSARVGAKRARKGNASSDDQLLGFGAGEAVALLTPVILSFTRSVWEALLAQAAQDSLHSVLAFVRAHRPGHHGAAGRPPPLTPAQLKLIRTVAEGDASRLDIPEGQHNP
jgi:hypothetical protein